ncbi:TetR family transcriptional regulator [Pseudonocardia alni]|jgi:AcrR family transcriptional regulator|uniref:TetR family transcriptional regulator n=2 Tax=Pseudonocardiaceae TaxID=2070 RepID=A0AA44UV98_PSEA5|nr:TetR family transcriptional regulator [Pseudonocardia alni]
MPKRVNHEERRRQIAEAVWRLASTTGLEDVTLRQVAAEAGVSMRLVQYYFGDRHALLVAALRILGEHSSATATERLSRATDQSPRALLRGVLLELLPLDQDRRTRHLVHIAYFVRSLGDGDLAAQFRDAPPELERLVASLLAGARGRPDDEIAPHLPDADALVALCDGLATKMLLGQRDTTDVLAILDRQLDLTVDAGPYTPA